MSLTIHGYLEQAYLSSPYLASTAEAGYGSQVQRVISSANAVHSQVLLNETGKLDPISSQVQRQIAAAFTAHEQVQRVITRLNALSEQVQRVISVNTSESSQAKLIIANKLQALSSQVQRQVVTALHLGEQVQRSETISRVVSSQVQQQIASSAKTSTQVLRNTSTTTPISSQVLRSETGTRLFSSQAQKVISGTTTTSSQVQKTIAASLHVASQTLLKIIDRLSPMHTQVTSAVAPLRPINTQVQRTISATVATSSQVLRKIAAAPVVSSQAARFIIAHLSPVSSQVLRILPNTLVPSSSQVLRVNSPLVATHSQVLRLNFLGIHLGEQVMPNNVLHEICQEYLVRPYLATPYLGPDICAQARTQVNRTPFLGNHYFSQVQRVISPQNHYSSQVQRILSISQHLNEQVSRTISAHLMPFNTQVQRIIAGLDSGDGNTQVQRVITAQNHYSEQVLRRFIDHLSPYNSQVQRVIKATIAYSSQVQRQVADHLKTLGEQIMRIQAAKINSQVTMVLYNLTNLRILSSFPSRGTTGINWTASSTAAGDYSANNLNNDIVEYVWRSVDSDKALVTLICDTQLPQGVFLDTLAILNHNLSKSATVTLQGSSDPTFATVGEEIILSVTPLNMYYLAPTLPRSGFRYYKFILQDNNNPAAFLSIGTIVFGAAIIFTGDDIVDQIIYGQKHFKDLIPTEGFTSVSNDRALKKYMRLQFKDLDFNRGNYHNLANLFITARTSHKCLWIPTPTFPDRFATFGKLTQIPETVHNVKGSDQDYIDLGIEVDESL